MSILRRRNSGCGNCLQALRKRPDIHRCYSPGSGKTEKEKSARLAYGHSWHITAVRLRACVALGNSGRKIASLTQTVSGNKATPSKNETATPTSTPIFWDSSRKYPQPVPGLYQLILDNKNTMTDIQFKDYLSSLKGQRIHLKATVIEVLADNRVYFEATGGGFFDTVYLSGLPRDILLALNKDQIVEFDATIVDFTEVIITVLDVDDPVVYSIH
jgi:hypothetical protein